MSVMAENVQLTRHRYPDPFLDMASTKLPKSFKKLLELCQIFAMTHPQISPIIWRLAEYSITSLVYKGESKAEEDENREVFEKHLRILEKLVEIGIDYYAYGNCLLSISFPFVRMYRCTVCKSDHQINEVQYRYAGGRFEGRCRTCKTERHLKPIDNYVRNPAEINIFRFEPQLITPKYNRVTGKTFYYYDMPPDLRRSVELGDRDIIDNTPVEYLECVRLRRKMLVKRIFHFKRPTLSGRDMQWGFPLILPALKDAYLNQIYKKADEVVAHEHSVPLRVLYPESRTQDPMQRLALGNFKNFMARNIKYWRQDPNAIITSPIPIGVANIGGDANAFTTIQSRVKVVDEIMGAMMVTRGFVLGGENWSSASISQRVMENSFINYLRRLDVCLQWIRDEVGSYLGLPPCRVSMKPFKKVDDVQMLQLILQLAREKKVSWNEALSRMELDSDQELKAIEKESVAYTELMLQELVAQNEANTKALVAQTVAQRDAQGAQEMLENMDQRADSVMQEIRGTARAEEAAAQRPETVDPMSQAMSAQADKASAQAQKDMALAQRYQMQDVNIGRQIALWAAELLKADDLERRRLMMRLRETSPEMAQAVVDVASQMQGGQEEPSASAMQPSQDPRAMLQALLTEAKNPEELAQRLQMIDPRQQSAVLLALSKTNPRLFNQVAGVMQKAQGAGGQVVDMRPQPEKLPPRREGRAV